MYSVCFRSSRSLTCATVRTAASSACRIQSVNNTFPRCFHTSRLCLEKENSQASGGKVALESKFEVGTQIPINIKKDGKDPEILPDDQYPEWLFECLKGEPTLADLEARKYSLRWDTGGRRYWKLLRRKKMKDENESRS
mmetsp:Transcript_3153/g.3556  ORF Transcript_3153/g.3556 Transcript_3153/m.3556 type:complete len:139 (+) Transcript_3153:90-506(+)